MRVKQNLNCHINLKINYKNYFNYHYNCYIMVFKVLNNIIFGRDF